MSVQGVRLLRQCTASMHATRGTEGPTYAKFLSCKALWALHLLVPHLKLSDRRSSFRGNLVSQNCVRSPLLLNKHHLESREPTAGLESLAQTFCPLLADNPTLAENLRQTHLSLARLKDSNT